MSKVIDDKERDEVEEVMKKYVKNVYLILIN